MVILCFSFGGNGSTDGDIKRKRVVMTLGRWGQAEGPVGAEAWRSD